MIEYHKIQSVFFRDPQTKHKTFLEGEWSIPEFEYLKYCEWEFTEKVDGTNIRIHWDGSSIVLGGRTENAQIPSFLLPCLNEIGKELSDKFKDYKSVTLFGEGFGPKIQKVGEKYRNTPGFVLFDVFIGKYLSRHNVEDIGKSLGIDVVPIIGTGTLLSAINACRNGFNSTWGEFRAEGVVARPKIDLFCSNGDRVITKIKCKDFDAPSSKNGS